MNGHTILLRGNNCFTSSDPAVTAIAPTEWSRSYSFFCLGRVSRRLPGSPAGRWAGGRSVGTGTKQARLCKQVTNDSLAPSSRQPATGTTQANIEQMKQKQTKSTSSFVDRHYQLQLWLAVAFLNESGELETELPQRFTNRLGGRTTERLTQIDRVSR